MRALGVFYNTLTAGATYSDRHVPRTFIFPKERLWETVTLILLFC